MHIPEDKLDFIVKELLYKGFDMGVRFATEAMEKEVNHIKKFPKDAEHAVRAGFDVAVKEAHEMADMLAKAMRTESTGPTKKDDIPTA